MGSGDKGNKIFGICAHAGPSIRLPSSFISTSVHSRPLPKPSLSEQCSGVSSRLGASCGHTSNISPKINYSCVIHFTEWGKIQVSTCLREKTCWHGDSSSDPLVRSAGISGHG